MSRPRVSVYAQGRHYRLGKTDEYGGIWRKRPWGWRLVSRYPLSDEAWHVAQQQFAAWEPGGPYDRTEGGAENDRRWPWIAGTAAVGLVAAGVAAYLIVRTPSATVNTATATSIPGAEASPAASSASAPQTSAPPTTAPPVGSGYLARGNGFAYFIQWTDRGGDVSGTLQEVTSEGTPPNETTSANTIGVSGSITGSAISLSFGGPDQFGTISGGSFTIDAPQNDGILYPLTFQRASAQEFNLAVAAIHSDVTSVDQQAAALAGEENAINTAAAKASQDISTLSNASFAQDLGNLESSVETLASELEQEQSNYATFRSDLTTNNQYGQACTDVGGSLAAELGGGLEAEVGGGIQPELQTLQSDITNVRQVAQAAPGDVSSYQNAQSSLPSYQPSTPVGALQPALAAAAKAVAQGISQGNVLIDKANSYVNQAYQLTSEANTAGKCGESIQAPSPIPHVS